QAPSGWHLLRTDDLSADELTTLQCLARVRLQADGRSLVHHLDEWSGQHDAALELRHETSHTALSAMPWQAREAVASRGRFVDPVPGRSGDFAFDVSHTCRPVRPWINVLANAGFGSQISETGAGMSWAVNSRMNQLTPWSNDPVADAPGEWLLLQDLRTREVWSVVPSAWGARGVDYHVVHGQGESRIRHRVGDLEIEVHWCVDAQAAVKQVRLRVVNHGLRTRALRVVAVAEWMLGSQRSDRATVVTSPFHQHTTGGGLIALMATQQEQSAGFGGGTAFLAALDPLHGEGADHDAATSGSGAGDWTCDRRECFDARGRPVLPDHFGQRHGSTGDPCAALALRLNVSAGHSAERTLLLGWAPSPAQAGRLVLAAAAVRPSDRLAAVRAVWDDLLGATEVHTPDPLFDALVNRWLLYQSVSCRLWAKAGFYQAGGATGFRDQLQDAMALTWAAPQLLREQIVRCASRQFVEGDVQHWWHEPLGAGVRTHFSDDLLWLPLALAHYLHRTGDSGVLDQQVAFIEGLVIPPGAEDIYGTPAVTAHTATVYEHAARTLDLSLAVGVHGLPLMGSGDWNDGMNRVGHEGRGESVWLAWFLCRVVADFAPLAQRRGEAARAQRWADAAQGWRTALEVSGWDGAWYQRAFFDGGEPLGSQHNSEARIDLIAQAWAVLSDAAPADHRRQALAAMDEQLVDRQAGLIRLLKPPLVHARPSAGYIQAYPAGVRENGGQYSHAGVWALMAQVAQARAEADPQPRLDLAWQYFRHLSPAHRGADPAQAGAYGLEPYVVAGDVYTAPPWVGRGGWSWYTGAAAWLHRAAVESLFGLEVQAHELSLSPGLPGHWPKAELVLRREGRTLRFLLLRASAANALALASPWGAGQAVRLLMPGERLDWAAVSGQAAFVVPLSLRAPAVGSAGATPVTVPAPDLSPWSAGLPSDAVA
ncbi:MAG: hypothetical protein RL375_3656, partial [Pseudomonadota bacterium]